VSVGESDDSEGTFCGTAAAVYLAGLVGEVSQLVGSDNARLFSLVSRSHFLGVKSSAECAHKSCDCGTDNIPADLLLESSQNCVVKECTALNNDILAQLVCGICTDNLVNSVLDDRRGKSCGDILNSSAVLLSLLYGAVHENGAAGTKVNRVLGEKSQTCKLGYLVAHCLSKGLDKGAAAR